MCRLKYLIGERPLNLEFESKKMMVQFFLEAFLKMQEIKCLFNRRFYWALSKGNKTVNFHCINLAQFSSIYCCFLFVQSLSGFVSFSWKSWFFLILLLFFLKFKLKEQKIKDIFSITCDAQIEDKFEIKKNRQVESWREQFFLTMFICSTHISR